MRIALDVDGPLYEWDKTARYMLRTYRDAPGLECESPSWNAIEETVTDEDWKWLWTEGVRLGLFRYGHVVQGAIIGVRELATEHTLVAVTHRPVNAVQDTIDWLSYLRLPFAEIRILSNEEPKSSAGADLLIDDRPENITEHLLDGRDAILFDRAWNQSYDAAFAKLTYARVKGWKEVVSTVRWMDATRRND